MPQLLHIDFIALLVCPNINSFCGIFFFNTVAALLVILHILKFHKDW